MPAGPSGWISPAGSSSVKKGEHTPAITSLLKSSAPPTAFVAYNDYWAIRVIETARSVGLKVPDDVSVVGFDDSVVAAHYKTPLTTINPEPREMGIVAVQMLLDKLENPRPRPVRGVMIQPRLVVRQSTLPPRRSGECPPH